MNKILVFCSNPVNGGTAEVFSEMCKEIQKRNLIDIEIIPCVNLGNDVKIYNTLKNLVKLDIKSEEQLLGGLKNNRSFLERILERINRNYKYYPQKKRNINLMKKYLADNDITSVFIHNGGYVGDDLCNQILQAAFEVGVKNRIMIFHSDFHKSFLHKLLCMRYDKKINKQTTEVITVSKFTRNRILSNSYLNMNIKVIYNGITFNNTLSEEKKMKDLNYINADIHIGMVGNFLENKGQMKFLEALFIVLRNTNKKIQVFMIGNVYDKEYFQQCENFIQTHKMRENVFICQNIYRAKEYMNLFDFSVIPSIYDESFGLIGVESMRSGTPVVAFGCGGIPEVVQHGVDGYIVEVGNITGMANAILSMIDEPEKRKKMGIKAKRNYEEKFSRKVMGDKYLNLIRGEK